MDVNNYIKNGVLTMKIKNKYIEIETYTENETKFLLNTILVIFFGAMFLYIFCQGVKNANKKTL